jgi:hypothetical protein
MFYDVNFNFRKLLILMCAVFFTQHVIAQVDGNERRFIRIGSLQSHYTAYGSERAWNNSYYEGLIWPAGYPFQDNAVIERFWFGVEDFTDDQGRNWNHYAVHSAAGFVGNSLFPVELKQTAKFEPPSVFVDGDNLTAHHLTEIDEYDPNLIADREVINVVNSSMGLTMTRRVLAFSQQYHSDYHIKEYTFTNTGKTGYGDDVRLQQTLKGLRVMWGIRYSVSREGSFAIGGSQSWGKHTWVTRRGETYAENAHRTITEAEPIVDWLRAAFSFAGQRTENAWDNIGGPYLSQDGRLTAPQHAGVVVLHVDRSPADRSDDPEQPLVLGWHAGDTYPGLGNMSPDYAGFMTQLYSMMSGNPHQGRGGTTRMDELYMESNPDPFTVHNDEGGTNVWLSFGPFDLEFGESITIVLAEGVSGLDRESCTDIGRRWKQAYDNPSDQGPFTLPNGTTTTDKNVFKNSWVFTGKDSIMMTFGRAKRNFDMGYNIPKAPYPPPVFDVTSGGDRITLSWAASPSEDEPGFLGYRIYRAVARPDTIHQLIYDGPAGVYSFEDTTPRRGFSYYYYIQAVSDGSNNTTGEANPTGELYSSRFYTRTTEPAFLRRQPGGDLDAIRVVPNPYNIRARDFQFRGEPDKIMFLNIPGQCIIRIYTERGDLVETIHHTDGSGDATWQSVSSSRQIVVSGVYIAHFTVTEDYHDPDTNELLYRAGQTAMRKFVIIR